MLMKWRFIVPVTGVFASDDSADLAGCRWEDKTLADALKYHEMDVAVWEDDEALVK
jgi:hypothetical protein